MQSGDRGSFSPSPLCEVYTQYVPTSLPSWSYLGSWCYMSYLVVVEGMAADWPLPWGLQWCACLGEPCMYRAVMGGVTSCARWAVMLVVELCDELALPCWWCQCSLLPPVPPALAGIRWNRDPTSCPTCRLCRLSCTLPLLYCCACCGSLGPGICTVHRS